MYRHWFLQRVFRGFHQASARSLPVAAAAAAGLMFLAALTPGARAQGLNWEGQTGAFITPFAYTSASPARGMGRPQASFHYLDMPAVSSVVSLNPR